MSSLQVIVPEIDAGILGSGHESSTRDAWELSAFDDVETCLHRRDALRVVSRGPVAKQDLAASFVPTTTRSRSTRPI